MHIHDAYPELVLSSAQQRMRALERIRAAETRPRRRRRVSLRRLVTVGSGR